MKLFCCQACDQVLFFENRACARCGHRLGFLPERCTLSAVEEIDGGWRALAEPDGAYQFCANAEFYVCNWLVRADGNERFCLACRHNRTVPALGVDAHVISWGKLELAKHRLFYTLLRLKLPTPNRRDDPATGLVFDFLADPPGQKVMTGHDEGLITLALAEADDAEREARRTKMGEPYRTLLGHFRHEIGHFYWNLLIRDRGEPAPFRAVFGDERGDYGEALARHYREGPRANWQDDFVSAYATSHPWEDWAETWAHYLHIVDGLETAAALGLRMAPGVDKSGLLHAECNVDPYREADFDRLAAVWLPLTIGLNAMNQGMGLNELYPFVLSPKVISKLAFIHDVVRSAPGHA